MTINFALSLSFEGIRLLHRVPGGWQVAGEVALDTPNLAQSMADLRETAQTLSPSGVRTKVLLPNDQIKFLAIDSPRTTMDDIHRAIDGATALPLDELVVDFDRSGGRTHIAAVAKQTLREAENFAHEHGFAPVSFVAVAEPFTFTGEVFFGATSMARDVAGPEVEIARDSAPIEIVGVPLFDNIDMINAAVAETTTPPIPLEVAEPPAAKITLDVRNEPAPVLEDVVEGAVVVEDAPNADDIVAEDVIVDDPAIAETVADDPISENPSDPISDFVFRRAAPEEDAEPAPLPDIEEPVFSSRARKIAAEEFVATPPEDALPLDAPDATVEHDAPAIPAPIIATPIVAERSEAIPPPPAPLIAAQTVAEPEDDDKSSGILGFFAGLRASPSTPVGPLAPIGGAAVGGKPRNLGLMLTAGLLVFMLVIALFAGSRTEDGIAGLFGFGADTPQDIATTDGLVPLSPAEDVVPALVPAPQTTDTATLTPPIVTTMPGQVLSPDEAARIYAATGVWQRAPRMPDAAQPTTLSALVEIAQQPGIAQIAQPDFPDLANATPDRALLTPLNPLPAGTQVERDARGFILASPDGTILPTGVLIFAKSPVKVPPLRPGSEPTPVPVIDEAPEISQTDPEAALVPEQSTAPDVLATVPQVDTTPLSVVPDLTAPDAAPATALTDTAPQSLPDVPEDAVPGLVIVAGRPTIIPPARPQDTLVPDADTAEVTPEVDTDAPIEIRAPGFEAYAASRPQVRPDARVPLLLLPPVGDPALAGLRPSLRPEGLAPEPIEEVEPEVDVAEETPVPEPTAGATDLSAIVASIAAAAPPSQIINPTRSAIAASPRPDTRPRNFARVVASARTLTTRQETNQSAQQTSVAVAAPRAAPTSSGSTTATVAQAATIGRAIGLRDINLIGVYGRPNDRRALVRLTNGRYVKVEIGSNLNGGRVTAIGDSALNYVVRGTTYALQMPSG